MQSPRRRLVRRGTWRYIPTTYINYIYIYILVHTSLIDSICLVAGYFLLIDDHDDTGVPFNHHMKNNHKKKKIILYLTTRSLLGPFPWLNISEYWRRWCIWPGCLDQNLPKPQEVYLHLSNYIENPRVIINFSSYLLSMLLFFKLNKYLSSNHFCLICVMSLIFTLFYINAIVSSLVVANIIYHLTFYTEIVYACLVTIMRFLTSLPPPLNNL